MPHFGQVVVGPPGSGKTTYCHGLQQFLTELGRPVALINLDPANDALPYECSIDIGELVRLDDIMRDTELGPNGAFVYAMEQLERNVDWLLERIDSLASGTYVVFDCPGQVELYTHHGAMRNILARLTQPEHLQQQQQQLEQPPHRRHEPMRLTAVQLIDSHVCTQPAVFVSACLLSLSVMLQLEMPHVNLLSKLDLLPSYGPLPFDLKHFAELRDLPQLQRQLDRALPDKRLRRLNAALCGLIDDFALVAFQPLNVQDKRSLAAVVKLADKANGMAFGGLTAGNDAIRQLADAGVDVDDNADNWDFDTD
eukprot:TRINITY_DN3968_c1_g2_i2.p1 TRINITY_DN3968_c1_g2~~TRINITY_DN3968_c1_g2_i2.p1  ORF type:complete len:310 (-),score=133.23 TRINITY_DN3968_c1_g2_i2:56-985(-)